MSILVDNAGVTRNVSLMWKDYAAQLGVGVDSLTQAQRVQAEYNGIMAETASMVGNLEKVSKTLAGTQAEAAMAGELLSRSYGSSMTPVVGLLTEGFTTFQNILRGAVEMFPGFTAGMTAGGVAVVGLTVVIPAGILAIKALGTQFLDASAKATIMGVSIKSALPTLALIGAAIGLVTWGLTAHAKAQEDAAKAAAEAAQAEKERLQGLRDENAELQHLYSRYGELTTKKKLTYTETKELYQVEQALEKQLGFSVVGLENLTGAYTAVTEAIKGKIAANEIELQKQRELDAGNAKTAAISSQSDAEAAEKAYQQLSQTKSDYLAEMEQLDQRIEKLTAMGDARVDPLIKEAETRKAVIQTYLSDLDAKFKNESIIMERSIEAWKTYIDSTLSLIAGSDISSTESFAQSLAQKLWGDAATKGFSSTANAQAFADQLVIGFTDAIDNADISAAQKAVDGYYQRVISGEKLSGAEMEDFQAVYQKLQQGAQDIGNAWNLTEDQVQTALDGIFTEMQGFDGNLSAWYQKWSEFDASKFLSAFQSGDMKDYDAAIKSAQDQAKSYDNLADSIRDARDAQEALRVMQQEISNQESETYKAALDRVLATTILKKDQVATLDDINDQLAAQGELEQNLTDKQVNQAQAYQEARLALLARRDALVTVYGTEIDQVKDLNILLYTLDTAYSNLSNSSKSAFDLSVGSNSFDPLTASAKEFQRQIDNITTEAGKLKKAIDLNQIAAENVKNWRKIAQAAKDGSATQKDYNKMLKDAGLAADTSFDDAIRSFDGMDAALKSSTNSMKTDVNNLSGELSALQVVANQRTDIKVNTSAAVAAVNALLAPLRWLMQLLGISGGGSGGGGGTSKYAKDIKAMEQEVEMERMSLEQQLATLEALEAKYRNRRGVSTLKQDDQRDLEQRIFDVQEEIRTKNLESAYVALDRKKALNQLSLQDEIAGLEAIKTAHNLTADELADIEERLYDTREALRQKQYQDEMALLNHRKAMGEITVQQELDMLQGIINAHQLTQDELWSIQEQMYALQQQQQQEALDGQTNAIQKAYNKIVAALKNRLQEEKDAELAALDDKIKILQDQTAAENEAAKVQDYEENLAEKQRQLRITKSARERRELQAEIDKLIADEQQRQVQLARQAEIDALKDQKDAVQDKYSKLMEEENLRQEALRLVMSNNLQAMSDLIASYGSQWEDAGASLAQHLTSGLASGSSAIINTIEALTTGMQQAVQRQFEIIGSTIPKIGTAGTVNITGDWYVNSQQDADYVIEQMQRRISRAGN